MTALSHITSLEDYPDHDWYAQAISAFEEIALTASDASVSLEDLLRLVGHRLCDLLNVTRCSVYLRRADGRFQGQVGYCASGARIDTRVKRLVTGVDQFTSEIIRTSAPVVIKGAPRDPRTIQRTMRRWEVLDMLGVPLVVDSEVIGIIYVDDRSKENHFSDRDIKLAEAFAGLSAFAVKQAWQWARLLKQTRTLDKERRILDRVAEVRSVLTTAMSEGASFGTIMQLAADLLGKPLVTYGADLRPQEWVFPAQTPERLTAQSPAMTSEQASHPSLQHLVAKLEHSSSHVVLKASPDLRCRRMFVRLTQDGATSGYLELCELGGMFSPSDAKVMEEVAGVMTLKLSMERQAATKALTTDDYVADLLHGRHDAQLLAERASAAGLDPKKRHFVLHYAPTDGPGAELPDRAETLAVRLGAALQPTARFLGQVAAHGHHLALFEVGDEEMPRAGIRTILEEVFDRVAGADVARGVFSEITAGLQHVTEAVHRLVGVSDMLENHASRTIRVAFADDFELVRLVASGDGMNGTARAATNVLRPLAEYDRASGGDLLATLRAFIDSGAQFRTAANRLGVHENTVRYRLHRVAEISSIDPGNLYDLSRAAFALQVERLLGPDHALGLLGSAEG